MRVGVIGLLHESNTFIAQPTTIEHFEQDTLLFGETVRERFAETPHELGGFFEGLAGESIEAVPLMAARAVPYGPITADAFQALLEQMLTAIREAGPLDGLLVAPHGATVCESFPDADGHWLQMVRDHLGDDIPIVGTLDAHANLSPQMVSATDALIAYRTNPHLDQKDRGVEAAQLLARILRKEVRPTQAAAFPPMAINIERQLTTESHLTRLYFAADEMLGHAGVLSNSLLLGFPYADVAEMGSSVLVVTDGDEALATSKARQLADELWSHRSDFVGEFISMDSAAKQALNRTGPVCLLDMGDNVGGGAPGDSTHLLHVLREMDVERVLLCLCDPRSVQRARSHANRVVELRIGGCTDDLHGPPFYDRFRVLGEFDGRFSDLQTRHGGFTEYDQGPSVVVQTLDERFTVLLTTRRIPPFSLEQLTSCNLTASEYQLVVAKGVNAPVAAYESVCPHLIRVNTPGCTCADMTQFRWQYRRRPLFPLEDCEWTNP